MAIRTALMSLVLAVLLLAQGCIIVPLSGLGGTAAYEEVTLRDGRYGAGKILVLDVDGAITGGPDSSGFFSSGSTVVEVTEKLGKAREDDRIRAVVLRVDSPGGGVTASDVIYKELLKYKEETGVPIYTSMLDLAASGGYYIAMASDEIYAHPTTVTGSIGVIAMFPQMKGLGDKLGVGFEVIKSGANKDIGGFWKQMSPEERAIMQSIIDDMYGNFVEIVGKNRTDLDEATIRKLADGRVYTASQAYDAGLVDGIMYLDEVIDHAANQYKEGSKPTVVLYRKTSNRTAESFYVKAPAAVPASAGVQTQLNLLNVSGAGPQAPKSEVFQYLWVP
ncbi:MAG: signal peptide peptidase SppA [Candidatus Sumerlaeia bacterium]|nr:signal peptide peptidase SppA [Candidatus Sumerlaeia bacterium]